MAEPTVCCVMLVNGRHEMVARAVQSFRTQTYERKSLLLLSTGPEPGPWAWLGDPEIWTEWVPSDKTIGALRNEAIQWGQDLLGEAHEVICHWDSDDYSHPRRIEEQVALLQSSGAECVGYHDLLFWDTRGRNGRSGTPPYEHYDHGGQAWLYSNPLPERFQNPPGTSLCYWRRTWERKHFRDTSKGEDLHFTSGLKMRTVSSIVDGEPRMIASIHGGNTSSKIEPGNPVWSRAAQWDSYCRDRMALGVTANA